MRFRVFLPIGIFSSLGWRLPFGSDSLKMNPLFSVPFPEDEHEHMPEVRMKRVENWLTALDA